MKKTAGVYTNDKSRPRLDLVITGPVEKFVTINPRHVNLRGFVGDSIKASVILIPEKKYPFKILNVRARNGKNISYRLEEIKQSDNTAYEIEVQNLKQDTGRYYDTIILETDSKIRPQLDVRVYGYLRPRKSE
jgi:hypothetical protein